MEVRVLAGAKAATTITSGNNETKAFEANATLRSTNSFSNMRSQMRQKIVCSAQVRAASTRSRQGARPRWARSKAFAMMNFLR